MQVTRLEVGLRARKRGDHAAKVRQHSHVVDPVQQLRDAGAPTDPVPGCEWVEEPLGQDVRADGGPAYMAINDALALVNRTGNLPVPLHLRNAPTKLMAELEYGKEYKYAHDYENHFVKQEYLPKEILGERLWKGQENPAEHKLIEQMRRLWGDRF